MTPATSRPAHRRPPLIDQPPERCLGGWCRWCGEQTAAPHQQWHVDCSREAFRLSDYDTLARADVYLLGVELSVGTTCADFFAWSKHPRRTDAAPIALADARLALGLAPAPPSHDPEIGSGNPPRAAEIEPPAASSLVHAGGSIVIRSKRPTK